MSACEPLFGDEVGESEPRPTSFVQGRDKDVIPVLIRIHAVKEPRILDVTHNKGVMWKGTPFAPVTFDINPDVNPDHVGDFRDLSRFAEGSFDVIAFDPPHLPAAAASANSSGIEREQYGLTEHGDYRQGDNVSPAFEPFLRETRRVLGPKGIVIAKIADLVHNHRYQWQHVDFINAARHVGMTPCDVVIKADPCAANLKSSKWESVKHFRRAHCYWIVVRNSKRCEA